MKKKMFDERNQTPIEFTDVEFSDFQEITVETIKKLVKCARKHNINEKRYVLHFARILFIICQNLNFFDNYEIKED